VETENAGEIAAVTSPDFVLYLLTQRAGVVFTYQLASLEPGAGYKVRLGFAEFGPNCSAGSRKFAIFVNSRLVESLDIVAETGACNVGLIREFPTESFPDGTVTIDFFGLEGMAVVNAIELFKMQ
jgi:Malectin domain